MNRVIMREKYLGCLLGLACGDALGTTVEFNKRGSFPLHTEMLGGGPFDLEPGQWTDDTSMALCLAKSLLERKQFDPIDQMRRYCNWMNNGYLSSNGSCFDIGGTTRSALLAFEKTGNPSSGLTDERTAGNGSIMRLAPIPMFFWPGMDEIIYYSGESSRTTHGTQECIDACKFLGYIIGKALNGMSQDDILFDNGYLTSRHKLCKNLASLAVGSYRDKKEDEIKSNGYVVNTLESALWCFHTTESFEEALIKAVNLGDDADTVGAVCGQIAGAYYGYSNIPQRWKFKIALKDIIIEIAAKILSLKTP